MIQKLVKGVAVPLADIREIKRGDVFQFVCGGVVGPLLRARKKAEPVVNIKYPSRNVWRVSASPHNC